MVAASSTPNSHITIVVLGDGGVGKSCLTLAYIGRGYVEDYDPTVEDYYSKTTTVDGMPYTVEIVDTAGQEEYQGLWSEATVMKGDAFVLCYSIDSSDSFRTLPSFLHTIRCAKTREDNPSPDTSNTPTNNPFVYSIIGTKSDVPPASRQIPASLGLQFARDGGGLFNETSAKMDVNVDVAFDSLIKAVIRARQLGSEANPNPALTLQSDRNNGAYRTGTVGSQLLSNDNVDSGEGKTKKGKKSLQMDRKASRSIGGLGRDPEKARMQIQDNHGGGCKCVVM